MYREIDTCPVYREIDTCTVYREIDTGPVYSIYFTQCRYFNYYNNADINECKTGANECDEDAECSNTDGGYECECRDGFTGNGSHCDGMVL